MIDPALGLDLNKRYTYADYLAWSFKDRVELLWGKVFKMSPAPLEAHQYVVMSMGGELYNQLKGKACRVYPAPFDVRLIVGEGSTEDAQIEHVVQPDLCVVCDLQKIDRRGCLGSPDLMVEVVSPSSSTRDLKDKYKLYQAAQVPEYWVVYPEARTVHVFRLAEDGQYQQTAICTVADMLETPLLPGVAIALSDVFPED